MAGVVRMSVVLNETKTAMSHYYWFSAYSQHQSEVRTGRKKGTHAVWRGPVVGAYIYADQPSVSVDFRSSEDEFKIASLPSGWIGKAIQNHEGTWTAEVFRFNVRQGKIYLT